MMKALTYKYYQGYYTIIDYIMEMDNLSQRYHCYNKNSGFAPTNCMTKVGLKFSAISGAIILDFASNTILPLIPLAFAPYVRHDIKVKLIAASAIGIIYTTFFQPNTEVFDLLYLNSYRHESDRIKIIKSLKEDGYGTIHTLDIPIDQKLFAQNDALELSFAIYRGLEIQRYDQLREERLGYEEKKPLADETFNITPDETILLDVELV